MTGVLLCDGGFDTKAVVVYVTTHPSVGVDRSVGAGLGHSRDTSGVGSTQGYLPSTGFKFPRMSTPNHPSTFRGPRSRPRFEGDDTDGPVWVFARSTHDVRDDSHGVTNPRLRCFV